MVTTGNGGQPPKNSNDTVDGFRNPVNSPVEVGSFSPFFGKVLYIPGGFLAGFLNHQQYQPLLHWIEDLALEVGPVDDLSKASITELVPKGAIPYSKRPGFEVPGVLVGVVG